MHKCARNTRGKIGVATLLQCAEAVASAFALCQSARMEQAYVLTGELRDGRSLVRDEAVPLAAGKVRVTVEALPKDSSTGPNSASISGIEKADDICGGDACIARTRVPVWVLEQARQLGASEANLLADYPSLTAADLANAWAYVLARRDEVDAAIRTNEEA